MAHFAEIGLNNTVLRVIVVANEELLDENGVEQESKGQAFCRNLFGGTWVQTSYNASFRKHYAGVGFTYDSTRDAFLPPRPYPSWTLNETTCVWEPPVPYPADGVSALTAAAFPGEGTAYRWDEATTSWKRL